MFKIIRRFDKYLLLFVALTILELTIVGCEYFPESTFELASESRLPKWITIPPGLTRDDVSITMSLFDSLWGSDVKIILLDKKGRTLTKVYGEAKGRGPLYLNHPPQGFPPGYPAYEVITINGITDIVELRKPEPIFYITDDPAVWKELGGRVQVESGIPAQSRTYINRIRIGTAAAKLLPSSASAPVWGLRAKTLIRFES
jgi:hypothetical protein